MKKLVLTTVCAMAVVGAAFAQGTISWASISFSSMTAQTNGTQNSPFFGGGATGTGTIGATAVTGAGFYYEVLYSAYTGSQAAVPTSFGALAAWSDAGLGATNGSTAGRLAVLGNENNTAATVPWANGVTNSIIMAGWSANLGNSWSLAVSNLQNTAFLAGLGGPAYFGLTATGYITPGTANPGVLLFGSAAQNYGLPIFSTNTQLFLVPIPEPTTLALAGLGGLSLLLIRRRK